MRNVITTLVVVVGLALGASADMGDQLTKLTANDGSENDYFGQSVAISGNTAIIGADHAGSQSGSAYLFDATTGIQLPKLTASPHFSPVLEL